MGNVGSIEKVMVFGILAIIVMILGIALWSSNDTKDPPFVSAQDHAPNKQVPLKPTSNPPLRNVPTTPNNTGIGARPNNDANRPVTTIPVNPVNPGSTTSNPGNAGGAGNTGGAGTTPPIITPDPNRPGPPSGETLRADPSKVLPKEPVDVTLKSTDSKTKGNVLDVGAKPGPKKYKIASGDTLTRIATDELGGKEHLDELLDANPGIVADRLMVGQEINLPDLTKKATPADPIGKPVARSTGTIPKTTTASDPPKNGKPVTPAPQAGKSSAGARTYTVKKGDTLYSISRQLYGTPNKAQAILTANKTVLRSARDLAVGMVLNIP